MNLRNAMSKIRGSKLNYKGLRLKKFEFLKKFLQGWRKYTQFKVK